MDEKRAVELDERMRRKEERGIYDEDYLLDRLESALGASEMDNLDGLATGLAAGLLSKDPDAWEVWISGTEEDRFAWKVVHALVGLLRESEPESLKLPPLFGWIVDVALGIRKSPPTPGRDRRAYRFRDLAIALTVDRIRNLKTRPATSNVDGYGIFHVTRGGWSPPACTVMWKDSSARCAPDPGRPRRPSDPRAGRLDSLPRGVLRTRRGSTFSDRWAAIDPLLDIPPAPANGTSPKLDRFWERFGLHHPVDGCLAEPCDLHDFVATKYPRFHVRLLASSVDLWRQRYSRLGPRVIMNLRADSLPSTVSFRAIRNARVSGIPAARSCEYSRRSSAAACRPHGMRITHPRAGGGPNINGCKGLRHLSTCPADVSRARSGVCVLRLARIA